MIRLPVRYRCWTDIKPVRCFLSRKEDFIVKEIPLPEIKRKFIRSGSKIRRMDGSWTLALIRKKGWNTMDLQKAVAKKLGIPKNDVTFAGNKDKNAVTEQWFSIKANQRDIKKLNLKSVDILETRPFNKRLFLGDLLGNEFIIRLQLKKMTDIKKIEKNISIIKKRGMPNYFGPQRFSEKNHIIGYWLIKDRKKALAMINSSCKKTYKTLECVPKNLLKFYIHALQSWIFNETINRWLAVEDRAYYKEISVVGWKTTLRKNKIDDIIRRVMKNLNLKIQDFKNSHIKVICPRGERRKMFIKVSDINYKSGPYNNLLLNFTLPKGSYATVLVGQITGNKTDWKAK
ncbi:MAG: tRNA pseudouridine(13) synthase TruD [Candidatus Aenigmarchaeota archaeon]|nr:tRNA pseudouridine(13) synthase TruD [Candidatus Aenigmarchaeota archaeon]